MPDAPISLTPRLSLKQYAEGANPGADALNGNLSTIDSAVAALQDGAAGQATAITTLETEIAADEANIANCIKKDGSVAMAADLDLGSNKVKNVADGVDPNDGVNVEQLSAAVSAAISTGINDALANVAFNFHRQHASRYVEGTNAGTWDVRGGSIDVPSGTASLYDEAGGRFQKWLTAASLNAKAGVGTTGTPGAAKPNRNFVYHAKVRTGSSLANLRLFFGFSYGDPTTFFNTSGIYCVGFAFDSATDSGHWLAQIQNDSSITIQTLTSAPIATDTVYYLKLDASTYTTDGKLRLYVNSVLIATITPGASLSATQDLDPTIMGKTLDTSAKWYYVGAQHLQQDAYPGFDASEVAGDFKSDGTVPMTGDLDLGGNKVIDSADATNPGDLVPLSQVEALIAAAIAGLPASSTYKKAMAQRTGGNVGCGVTPSDIPGLTVTVTHAGGPLEIRFSGALLVTAFSGYSVYFVIGATTYSFGIMNQNNGSHGDYTAAWPAFVSLPLNLPAGTYAIKVQHSGTNAVLSATAATPASLVVDYVGS